MAITETAPFGIPQRDCDTTQGEAISKLAAIKDDEKQFHKSTLNVLFVDFVNPFFGSGLNLMASQQRPLILSNGEWTRGALWHAMYAKKGDLICEGLRSFDRGRRYVMEYDGRLRNKKSIVHLVIANLPDGLTVFEKLCHQLPHFAYSQLVDSRWISHSEDLWINWPRANLRNRINVMRRDLAELPRRMSDKE